MVSKMKLNLDFLNNFIQIAEYGSFSKTAKKLKMSQSAISQQIENLELFFGAILFIRSVNGVELTEEGKILLKRSKIILDNIKLAKSEIKNLINQVKGMIRISASTILGEHILPKYMIKFKNMNPAINFQTEVNDSKISIMKLIEGQADFAAVGSLFEYIEEKMFETIVLAEEELCVVVGKHHELAKQENVTAEDILKYSFIFRETSSGTRQESEKILSTMGISLDNLKRSCELATTESILTAISEEQGISIISSIAALKLETAGLVKCLKLPKSIPSKRKLYLVKLEGNKKEKKSIDLFWKFMKEFEIITDFQKRNF